MKSLIIIATAALLACGPASEHGPEPEQEVAPASSPASMEAVPELLAAPQQSRYNPMEDGQVILVDQGIESWNIIANAMIWHLYGADIGQIRYARNMYGIIIGTQWYTKAVFFNYYLWNNDGSLASMINYVKSFPDNPNIRIYIFAHDPDLEAAALALGADEFLLVPAVPDGYPPYENIHFFSDLAYKEIYGVPPVD